MNSQTQYHMGTQVEVEIFDVWDFQTLLSNAFAIFQEMEQIFSRFLPDSLLSQLNQKKVLEVPPVFLEVLEQAQYFYKISQGYFNPLINLSALWYQKSFETLEKQSIVPDIQHIRTRDMSDISLHGNTVALRGTAELDFWGIVKGYTVDRVKEYLLSQGIKNFLINAGGDIYMSGICHQDDSCIVWIDNPFDSIKLAATFSLQDSATATSGTYKRKWQIGKTQYHHILNPHTGENPSEIVSLTVIAPDCITADVSATVGIAMGLERATEFYEKEQIPALFILHDKKMIMNSFWDRYTLELLSL